MIIIKSLLNLPWSICGIVIGTFSIPSGARLKESSALVITVKSLWWAKIFSAYKNIRAVTIGQVILMGPNTKEYDLAHEIIHVRQILRQPLVQPILYTIATIRFGYQNNKYEKEAYEQQRNLQSDL